MWSAPLDCGSKYVTVLTIIVPELEFSDIQMQILLGNLMISTDNSTLEDRPEALDCVGVNRANDVLANSVVNRLVRETALKTAIAGISIGAEEANPVRYGLPHESLKRSSVGPLDNARNDIALALDCANDRSLAGISPPARSAFLIPMPVLVAPADVGFINFNDPAKLLDVLDHRSSDLVAHEPSSLVRAEAHIAEDLEGAHALLADQHQVRDAVPVFQRLIRVLKDCAGQVRETIALVCAGVALPLEGHCRDRIYLLRIAARAADAFRPTPRDQILDAIVLSLKQFVKLLGCQLVDRLRMLCAGQNGLPIDCKETLA
jgi:hypothetical protein